MYKFCTHCGAKMPNENAFCTNCGAKFSQIPTPQQNMAPTNINYNTSNSNTMPPYMHNQQTQQINNMPNPNNMQMASQEFAIGQQYMDINNPQHNYIKAINHFQKSSLLGNQNAKFYMAMAYLYQAMDILKQSAPLQNNPSPSVNNFSPQAPFFPQNPNNHGNQQFASNPNNQTNQNNDNSTLKNVGKYAAAAAVGAVASSMLHSASTASEQITPVNTSDDGTNHISNLDNNSELTATEQIEPSADTDISSDSGEEDSSISDSVDSLFDDLFGE